MGELTKFLIAVLDKCEGRGMQYPFTVCCVSRKGALYCVRISEHDEPRVLAQHSEGEEAERDLMALPITIFVADSKGEAAHAVIEDPDVDRLALH